MKPRTKALLGSAATVVVIALVIIALWAFGSPRKTTPPTIMLSPQQRSQQALDQGLAALSKEQTGTAIELFESAITMNPDNAAAKDALAKAKSGTSSTSSGSSTSGSSSTGKSNTATKTVPVAPASTWEGKLDLAKLVPRSYPDESFGGVSKSESDIVVTGSPSKQGATVTKISWAVHDRATDAAAADFIKKVSKSLYAHDAASLTINGTPAYFGTDGKLFATVVFTRGRYVFEVVVTTTEPPADVQAFAQGAAAAFPSAP